MNIHDDENISLLNEQLKKELRETYLRLDQTEVQLAGCGAASLQNTEESKTYRVVQGAYGWSDSYDQVCRAVDREIALRAEVERLTKENKRLQSWNDRQRDMLDDKVRKEPSRLEIAAMLKAGWFANPVFENNCDDKWWIEQAEALIQSNKS